MYEDSIINYENNAWAYRADKTHCVKTCNYDEFSKSNMRLDIGFNILNLYRSDEKLTHNKLLISIRVVYNV